MADMEFDPYLLVWSDSPERAARFFGYVLGETARVEIEDQADTHGRVLYRVYVGETGPTTMAAPEAMSERIQSMAIDPRPTGPRAQITIVHEDGREEILRVSAWSVHVRRLHCEGGPQLGYAAGYLLCGSDIRVDLADGGRREFYLPTAGDYFVQTRKAIV